MKRLLITMAGLAGWLLGGACGQAQNQGVLPNPRLLNSELLARGKTVFVNHCAGCHGVNGDGNGPGAYGLNPKPRILTNGVFKFRTTMQGMLPTDEDLFRTVRQGLPGSSMPPFELMAERDVLAVVQYIKLFSEAWRNPDNYAAPLYIPSPPDWFKEAKQFAERAAKGKAIYDMSCINCHGEKGDGRGFSAPTLVDLWNNPIPPTDLRQPIMRSGRTLTDLYKVIVTGLNGTPMPTFSETTTEDQRWEIVAYIEVLRQLKAGKKVALAASPAPAMPATAPTAPTKTAPGKDSGSSQYE